MFFNLHDLWEHVLSLFISGWYDVDDDDDDDGDDDDGTSASSGTRSVILIVLYAELWGYRMKETQWMFPYPSSSRKCVI